MCTAWRATRKRVSAAAQISAPRGRRDSGVQAEHRGQDGALRHVEHPPGASASARAGRPPGWASRDTADRGSRAIRSRLLGTILFCFCRETNIPIRCQVRKCLHRRRAERTRRSRSSDTLPHENKATIRGHSGTPHKPVPSAAATCQTQRVGARRPAFRPRAMRSRRVPPPICGDIVRHGASSGGHSPSP